MNAPTSKLKWENSKAIEKIRGILGGEVKDKLSLFQGNEIESWLQTTDETKTWAQKIEEGDLDNKQEEIVRQLYRARLIRPVAEGGYGYPQERVAIEKRITVGSGIVLRADIVVYDDKDYSKDEEEHTPEKDILPGEVAIVVEAKAPGISDGKKQLESYCRFTGAPYGVWTNGQNIACYHLRDLHHFDEIKDIPTAEEVAQPSAQPQPEEVAQPPDPPPPEESAVHARVLVYSVGLPGGWGDGRQESYPALIEQMGRNIDLSLLCLKFRAELRLEERGLSGHRLNIHLPLRGILRRMVAGIWPGHLQKRLQALANRLYLHALSDLPSRQVLGPEDHFDISLLREGWTPTAAPLKAGHQSSCQIAYIPLRAKGQAVAPLLPPPFQPRWERPEHPEHPLRLYLRLIYGGGPKVALEVLLPTLLYSQQLNSREGWLLLLRRSSHRLPGSLLNHFSGTARPLYRSGPPHASLSLLQKGAPTPRADLLPLRAIRRGDRLPPILRSSQQIFSPDPQNHSIILCREELHYPINRLFLCRSDLRGFREWLSRQLGFAVNSGGISWLLTDADLHRSSRELPLLSFHYRAG